MRLEWMREKREWEERMRRVAARDALADAGIDIDHIMEEEEQDALMGQEQNLVPPNELDEMEAYDLTEEDMDAYPSQAQQQQQQQQQQQLADSSDDEDYDQLFMDVLSQEGGGWTSPSLSSIPHMLQEQHQQQPSLLTDQRQGEGEGMDTEMS